MGLRPYSPAKTPTLATSLGERARSSPASNMHPVTVRS